jgi:hypothetical protein
MTSLNSNKMFLVYICYNLILSGIWHCTTQKWCALTSQWCYCLIIAILRPQKNNSMRDQDKNILAVTLLHFCHQLSSQGQDHCSVSSYHPYHQALFWKQLSSIPPSLLDMIHFLELFSIKISTMHLYVFLLASFL